MAKLRALYFLPLCWMLLWLDDDLSVWFHYFNYCIGQLFFGWRFFWYEFLIINKSSMVPRFPFTGLKWNVFLRCNIFIAITTIFVVTSCVPAENLYGCTSDMTWHFSNIAGYLQESVCRNYCAASDSIHFRYRDEYKDRDYKRRSRSRSRDRYDRDRHHRSEKEHRYRSRSRSASPDNHKRGKYDDERRSRSRSYGRYKIPPPPMPNLISWTIVPY